jgi:hypothetical protein
MMRKTIFTILFVMRAVYNDARFYTAKIHLGVNKK